MMILNDKIYNVLKWGIITLVPASILLISTLGTIYGFDTEKITLTISAVATFFATLLGISTVKYNKSK